MKKEFIEPELEISRFELADILTVSGIGDTEDDKYSDKANDWLGWF